jgi:hypothetical protein
VFRNRTLAYVVIATIGATAPMVLGATSTRAATPDVVPPAQVDSQENSSTVEASRLIGTDGSFLGTAGMTGTIDTGSWELVSNLATGEAPHLAPVNKHPNINPAIQPAWSALGGSGNGAVTGPDFAMAVFDNDLYIGGDFSDVAGIPTADYIARWDGNAWHNLDSNGLKSSITDVVSHLIVWKNDLYVGGDFKNADGIQTADYLARWDGSAWHNVGSNGAGNGAFDSVVTGLGAGGGFLYIGGIFFNVGGDPAATHFVRWNGTTFSKLGSGPNNTPVFNNNPTAIVVVGTSVYVGGDFTNAAGIKAADFIARWSNGAWHALGSGPAAGGGALNNYVFTLAALNGSVYAGGQFTNTAGNTKADYIARWSGTKWYALGSNGANNGAVDDPVLSIARYGTDLYVGGSFDITGVPNSGAIARWNGSKWFAVGNTPALTAQVDAVALNGNTLYVGGDFEDADGIPQADRVAAFGPLSFHQPDGSIGLGGPLVGNNIYNATGASQTQTGYGPSSGTITSTMSVGNDGNINDAFKVHATGAATSSYVVRYFDGATEITNSVANGTYKTPTLAPGATHILTATVRVKASAALGSSVTRLLTISSAAEPSKLDAVKLVGKRQ